MMSIFNVSCMMCGRSAGQLQGRHFVRAQGAPPPVDRGGRMRCGYCGGNLYLEPDDSGLAVLSPEATRRQPRMQQRSA